jgi:hypothetical protein
MTFDNASPQNPRESSAENKPSSQTDASTSAFLTSGREVDGPCLNEDIPPYHPPVPDPDGRLAQAQLVGALLVSNALVRSFLRHKHPLDSLTTLPQCIEQGCQAHPLPLSHLPCLPEASLTLSVEWGYDRTVSRLLFDHDYVRKLVRKLPLDACDPQRLQRYVQKTVRNDAWNVSRLYEETLRYTDAPQDEDAPFNVLEETCAAPLPAEQPVRQCHATLTEICDLLHVCRTTGEILFRYYVYDDTEEEIKATYGVTLGAALKRMERAIKKHPVRGAQAKAALQEQITEMHRTEPVPPRKCTPPEKVEAAEDDRRLEPETEEQCGQDVPTIPKRRSTDAQEG